MSGAASRHVASQAKEESNARGKFLVGLRLKFFVNDIIVNEQTGRCRDVGGQKDSGRSTVP